MSDQVPSESLAAIIDETLAAPALRDQVRLLSTHKATYSPALVAAFLSRAHAEMRQNPGAADQQASLATLVAREIGDNAGLIASLRAQGQALVLHGQFPRALKAFDDALAILHRDRSHDDEIGELEVLRLQPLINLERYSEARNSGGRLLAEFEMSGNSEGLVRTRMALARASFIAPTH